MLWSNWRNSCFSRFPFELPELIQSMCETCETSDINTPATTVEKTTFHPAPPITSGIRAPAFPSSTSPHVSAQSCVLTRTALPIAQAKWKRLSLIWSSALKQLWVKAGDTVIPVPRRPLFDWDACCWWETAAGDYRAPRRRWRRVAAAAVVAAAKTGSDASCWIHLGAPRQTLR